jgi:hypothetical protein
MEKQFEPLISKDLISGLSDKEKMNVTNIEMVGDFEPIEESNEITLKPFEKLWNDVSHKIKWVSKPKKSHPYFDYIYEELSQIYGKKIGNLIMRILLDILEVEFQKISGTRIDWDKILYGGCSLNQWRKLITEVDKMYSKCGEETKLQIQKVEKI